jgi:hypothetical protein
VRDKRLAVAPAQAVKFVWFAFNVNELPFLAFYSLPASTALVVGQSLATVEQPSSLESGDA